MTRTQRVFFAILLILVVGLRLGLVLFNREANDDHMQVVTLIQQTGRLPTKADCWECFQPKLFHFSVAGLSQAFNVNTLDGQIVLAQSLNLLLGLVTLWVLWRLLNEMQIGDWNTRLLAFGLLALNPNLLTTSIQATNDTFVIAFSSLAVYFAWHFFGRQRWLDFGLMTVFAVLAASSKSNGAVVTVAIVGFLLLRALLNRNFSLRWRDGDLLPAFSFGLLTLVLVVLNPLNQYFQNMQTYGSPVTMNMERAADPAQLFTPTETYRPGIVSIVDGFFTFKLTSLLFEPQITNDNHKYPEHRTSFWTILFGRSNFLQYDPWPQSWINTNKVVRNLGRVLYMLALLPSLALLAGLLAAGRDLFPHPGDDRKRAAAGFFLILLAAFLGFAVLYALEYRIYTVIKTIFIFPALLSFGYLYLKGFDWIQKAAFARLAWLFPLFQVGVLLLLAGYALDAGLLLLQLAHWLILV